MMSGRKQVNESLEFDVDSSGGGDKDIGLTGPLQEAAQRHLHCSSVSSSLDKRRQKTSIGTMSNESAGRGSTAKQQRQPADENQCSVLQRVRFLNAVGNVDFPSRNCQAESCRSPSLVMSTRVSTISLIYGATCCGAVLPSDRRSAVISPRSGWHQIRAARVILSGATRAEGCGFPSDIRTYTAVRRDHSWITLPRSHRRYSGLVRVSYEDSTKCWCCVSRARPRACCSVPGTIVLYDCTVRVHISSTAVLVLYSYSYCTRIRIRTRWSLADVQLFAINELRTVSLVALLVPMY